MDGDMSECPFKPIHPLDPSFVRDPYPYLAEARVHQPIYFVDELNLWVVTRYSDVKQILRNPSAFCSKNVQQPIAPLCAAARQVLAQGGFAPGPSVTSSDGAVHANLRAHILKAFQFTPNKLSDMQPAVVQATHELIDAFIPGTHADLVRELATLLPARVIFEMIGFPSEDHAKLLSWCTDRLRLFWGRATEAEQVESAKGMVAYWDYCVKFVDKCSIDIPDTPTGTLLKSHYENPTLLTKKDITTAIFGFIVAGQETTANLISTAAHFLLSDRSRWEAIWRDRTLVPAVIEESLRLHPPIWAWRRTTTQAVEIGGIAVPQGAELLLHLGSSGRDEDVFSNGEEFATSRSNASQHLAFGHGIHFCLGAPLARLEARIVLEALLDRLPGLRLAPGWSPAYEPNVAFRALKSLQVEWDA